jgi:hypothetical protein
MNTDPEKTEEIKHDFYCVAIKKNPLPAHKRQREGKESKRMLGDSHVETGSSSSVVNKCGLSPLSDYFLTKVFLDNANPTEWVVTNPEGLECRRVEHINRLA